MTFDDKSSRYNMLKPSTNNLPKSNINMSTSIIDINTQPIVLKVSKILLLSQSVHHVFAPFKPCFGTPCAGRLRHLGLQALHGLFDARHGVQGQIPGGAQVVPEHRVHLASRCGKVPLWLFCLAKMPCLLGVFCWDCVWMFVFFMTFVRIY